jgi:hypothetical protein
MRRLPYPIALDRNAGRPLPTVLVAKNPQKDDIVHSSSHVAMQQSPVFVNGFTEKNGILVTSRTGVRPPYV